MSCRAASQVKSRQAWHAAVRHTGLLFQLPKPPLANAAASTSATATLAGDPPFTSSLTGASHADDAEAAGSAACLDATDALPYPQLAQTVSSANFAPAAHLAEHYSPPGGDCSSSMHTVHVLCVPPATAVVSADP